MPRALAAALSALALVLAACGGDDPEPFEDEPEPSTAPLTGLATEDDLDDRPVLAVKVDNAPRARPQAGLEVADVVFEERVEGGNVRFVALFHSEIPDVVGPVRSARPVDAEILSGFGGSVLAYSGARDEVAAMLRDAPLVLLTEGAAGFRRADDRPPPHDLYLDAPETLEAGIEAGGEGLDEGPWRHDVEAPDDPVGCPEGEPDCADPGRELTVAVSPAVDTTFTWDEDAGLYRRTQDGERTEVVGDGEVGVANVVVLATRHYRSGCCDTAGQPYDDTEVIGEDRALVLRDGEAHEARWEKSSATAPLRLLDADGEDLPLAPGGTWVLLPPDDAMPPG